ncbi:unnamed protein product [Cuscuta europaea]|uniref:Retrotransposon gag domain-containing protein n=1 Tax=Cuscuta europaea TaxID=41803 RepID=A0A9P0ZNC7_CUSEU|nr:unnamed protein product [Cuscuta europaea]
MKESRGRREMEGRRMSTRNKPRGLAAGASVRASRATSLGSRGRRGGRVGRGGHHAQTVSDDHVSSVYETNTQNYDPTFVLETEHEETPYDGGDFHTDDDDDNSESDARFAQMGELFEWYQKEKVRRDLRRQARRASQGGSGQGSRGASRAVSGASRDRREGDFCVRISKYLKEARALGCRSFDGTGDITVVTDWIKKVKDAARDMQITPDMKLTVASRLLEGISSTWWESVEGKYRGNISWASFEQEFYAQYYSDYEVNVKHREYTNLKQKEGVIVKQLEQEFRTLARFLPEYAADEDRMTEHFWDALLLDIRDRATYSRHMTFSEVVEQGMLGETQWND